MSGVTQPDQRAPIAATARVQVRDLTKVFHTRRGSHVALDNISLDIAAGEFLVLLGPSGCGKTTLLRCVAGLEAPDTGEIIVDGRTVFSASEGIWLPPEKRRLSMVFQSYALWPHMTVFENIAYPLRNIGRPKAEIAERVTKVTKVVGLDTHARAYPGQLSGGQQQRVALARAIVWDADVVLFDEPLSNLDAKVRDRLRAELLKLQADLGFSALYVTHDQVEAMALADRIVVMQEGRIAQIGRPADIYDLPRSRYVADFVGSVNEVPGVVAEIADGHIRVDTPIGPLFGVAGAEPVTPAQPVIAMFRPQHCKPVSDDGGGEARNRLRGTVSQSQFLGIQVERVVRVAGTDVVVCDTSGGERADGDDLRFTIDPDRVRIFPRGAGTT